MTAAAPARFDRASQHRRAMIAKIKVAQKEMRLVDDDYRALLMRVTGEISAANCDDRQLAAMVEEMKRLGFRPKPARRPGRPAAPADHPTARKARALWISLHQLGAIDNPSEQALEAFARRQLGVERLQWANQSQGYKLIEALKAIGERHGWSLKVDVVPRAEVRVMKLRLCEAILAKLKARGLAGADWSLREAAFRLLGIDRDAPPAFWNAEHFEELAAGLGAKLRAA